MGVGVCAGIPLGYDRNRHVCGDGRMPGSSCWSCPFILGSEAAAAAVGIAGTGERAGQTGPVLAYVTRSSTTIELSAITPSAPLG